MKSLECLTNECITLLKKNKFLLPLIRIEYIKSILRNVSIENNVKDKSIKKFLNKFGYSDDQSYEDWLIQNNLTEPELQDIALYELRLKKYCKENFDNQVGARFLERKHELDIVVYSLLRTKEIFKAREFYFRLLEQEAEFGDLAARFSEGIENKTRGIVGPTPVGKSHPKLAEVLRNSKPGEIIEPLEIDRSYILVRVEYYEPAKLDDFMREKMREELFNAWVNDQVNDLSQKLLNKNKIEDN